MSKRRQTRRTISINGYLYKKLMDRSVATGEAMATIAERLLMRELGVTRREIDDNTRESRGPFSMETFRSRLTPAPPPPDAKIEAAKSRALELSRTPEGLRDAAVIANPCRLDCCHRDAAHENHDHDPHRFRRAS